LQIVERIIMEYGGGKLPADRTRLVALVVDRFAVLENIPADIRSRLSLAEWEESQACLAMALVQAIDCVERDARSEWRN
jgi:hypothetical protein